MLREYHTTGEVTITLRMPSSEHDNHLVEARHPMISKFTAGREGNGSGERLTNVLCEDFSSQPEKITTVTLCTYPAHTRNRGTSPSGSTTHSWLTNEHEKCKFWSPLKTLQFYLLPVFSNGFLLINFVVSLIWFLPFQKGCTQNN